MPRPGAHLTVCASAYASLRWTPNRKKTLLERIVQAYQHICERSSEQSPPAAPQKVRRPASASRSNEFHPMSNTCILGIDQGWLTRVRGTAEALSGLVKDRLSRRVRHPFAPKIEAPPVQEATAAVEKLAPGASSPENHSNIAIPFPTHVVQELHVECSLLLFHPPPRVKHFGNLRSST